MYIHVQVSLATGEAFAKNSNAIFRETSAKDGSNVHSLFRTIGKVTALCGAYILSDLLVMSESSLLFCQCVFVWCFLIDDHTHTHTHTHTLQLRHFH